MKKSSIVKGKCIEVALFFSVLTLQLLAWGMFLNYAVQGGVIGLKGGYKSIVEAGDLDVVLASLILFPFVIKSIYNLFQSLLSLYRACFGEGH